LDEGLPLVFSYLQRLNVGHEEVESKGDEERRREREREKRSNP
jgi:hypothetical protein